MEYERPFDAINASKNKRVLVELKNKRQITGILKSFDTHINIVLDEAEEREEGTVIRKLGTVFIRGDTIILMSPA